MDDFKTIEKGNYIFGLIQKPNNNKVFIFRKESDDLRFLYKVRLQGNEFIEEQHEYVAYLFLDRLKELDHKGHTEDEIFHQWQKKKEEQGGAA